ncbi:MAG TPA: hypothetical protein ENF80_01105 [Thermofilum sp.]|nr:hypothetical protein [Thermofilum sp.]
MPRSLRILLALASITLLIVLALLDIRLALLALLLWLLLSMFFGRKGVQEDGKALIRSKKTLLSSYNMEPERKKIMMSLTRGMKISRGDISPSQMVELAINISRKMARSKGRRKVRASSQVIDFVLPRKKYFKISIPATLRRAAASQRFPSVAFSDLRASLQAGKGKVSLIVVLDSSASMIYSIRGILTAFKAIKNEARKYRDRVSLIVSKGFSSVVAQHPTTNFNLVLSKFSVLGLDDFTPLASGMYRGYDLAVRERRRGYEPVIIIITDGNVNVPLEKYLRGNIMSPDPAIESVLEVARLIAKSKIETVIVNTRHRDYPRDPHGIVTGTQLLTKVAEIVKGTYVGVLG